MLLLVRACAGRGERFAQAGRGAWEDVRDECIVQRSGKREAKGRWWGLSSGTWRREARAMSRIQRCSHICQRSSMSLYSSSQSSQVAGLEADAPASSLAVGAIEK